MAKMQVVPEMFLVMLEAGIVLRIPGKWQMWATDDKAYIWDAEDNLTHVAPLTVEGIEELLNWWVTQ